MTIIDLDAERVAREQPDADCVKRDQFGQPMYLFALDYRMDDSSWTTNIWAYSWEDAEARVAAMRNSLVVVGQMYAVIPA